VLVLCREGQHKIINANFSRAAISVLDINNDAHTGDITDNGVPIAVFFPPNICQRTKDVLKRGVIVAAEACAKNCGSSRDVQCNNDGSLRRSVIIGAKRERTF
jgi:hypothetical protein